MSQLSLIVRNEYVNEIRRKSFWIATFIAPVIMIAFGAFVGVMAEDSDSLSLMANPAAPDAENFTLAKLAGMMIGAGLTVFIMIYGAQIFNKVKQEKTNRIMEILCTCVDGRTLMLGKIISVALIGITQLALWALLILVAVFAIIPPGYMDEVMQYVFSIKAALFLIWGILFFFGGYVFYGSLYAAVGAMTDKNQENAEYMTVLTMILLASFYIGEYAIDHTDSVLVLWGSFIPFISPTIGAVGAISGEMPLWLNLLSLLSLYIFAGLSLSIAGKIYRSTLLLKGKRFSIGDIVTFLKSK